MPGARPFHLNFSASWKGSRPDSSFFGESNSGKADDYFSSFFNKSPLMGGSCTLSLSSATGTCSSRTNWIDQVHVRSPSEANKRPAAHCRVSFLESGRAVANRRNNALLPLQPKKCRGDVAVLAARKVGKSSPFTFSPVAGQPLFVVVIEEFLHFLLLLSATFSAASERFLKSSCQVKAVGMSAMQMTFPLRVVTITGCG